MRRIETTGTPSLVILGASCAILLLGCGQHTNSDDDLTQTCAETCPLAVAAGCDEGPPSLAACETGCVETATTCPAEFDAVITCGGENPTLSCGTNGMVYTNGCESEQDAIYACLAGVPMTCLDTCPLAMAAGCDNGPPTLAECQTGCAETQANCPVEFNAVIACGGENPTVSCGANGMVYTDGCETEQDALYTCLGL